jgi:TfoX/Sxy family transcriptional regulator of competence genes
MSETASLTARALTDGPGRLAIDQPAGVFSVAYDESLAARVGSLLAERDDVTERKMFGGIAFMVGGHMAIGVARDELMVRVGVDGQDRALAEPHTRQMDFTGRPMRGMVFVAAEGLATDADLRRWVAAGVAYASAQPPKDA